MTEESRGGLVNSLVNLAAAAQLAELEAAWMEAIEDDAFDASVARAVLETVADQNAPKMVESLVWVLVSTWTEAGRADGALAVVRGSADLLPDSALLREELAGLYRVAQADVEAIDTLVAMTIERDDLPLPTGLARLETLLRLPPGTFVVDPRRKHPGCVIGIDADRKVLRVSFGESERGYDAVNIEAIERGDPDDYRALVTFAPERLQEMAEHDPARLARLVLKARGPEMKFRDVKAALEPVIPAKAWSKWWAGAKSQVKRSPHIEMSNGTQPTLVLRRRALSFEDEARDAFDEAAGTEARLAAVLGFLEETGHDPQAEAEVLRYFDGRLSEPLAVPSAADPEALVGSLAVLAEMRRSHPDLVAPIDAAALLPDDAALAALLARLGDEGIAACLLRFLRDTLPERWPGILAVALPSSRPSVCDQVAAALADAGRSDLLTQAAEELMRRPNDYPGGIFWLWQAATAGRFAGAFAELDRVSLSIRFLLSVDDLGRSARDDRSLRPLVAEVRSAVDPRSGILKSVLDAADDTQAKDIRAALERNASLTDAIRSRALDLIRRTHPEHFVARALEPWEEDDVLYTTDVALRHQEEIYGELVTTKMMANSQAIGDAAAHGDISENAEFTAALEEQQRLSERAERLQADIGRARIISPSMAASETVTVGSRVRVRSLATGAEETFTFLGPWDTDIANHIYFYRAPLALAFMGRKAGDTVTFGEGTSERQWDVLEVGLGL